jgi:hypothetical protein
MNYQVLKKLSIYLKGSDLSDLDVFYIFLNNLKLSGEEFGDSVEIIVSIYNQSRQSVDKESQPFIMDSDLKESFIQDRIEIIDAIKEAIDNKITILPYILDFIKCLDVNDIGKLNIAKNSFFPNLMNVFHYWAEQINRANSNSVWKFNFGIEPDSDIYSKCLIDNIRFRSRKQTLDFLDRHNQNDPTFRDNLDVAILEYSHLLNPQTLKYIEEFRQRTDTSVDSSEKSYRIERNAKSLTLTLYYLLYDKVTPYGERSDIEKVITFITGLSPRSHRDAITALFPYANQQEKSATIKKLYDNLKEDYDPQVRNLLKGIMDKEDMPTL